MTNELWLLLIRNTLASWLINPEFAAPLIMLIIARKNRRQHPKLTRFLPLPVSLLILAGLVRQVYEQMALPWVLINGAFAYDQLFYVVFEALYALLLLLGFAALLWAVYYQCHVPSSVDPFAELSKKTLQQ